MHLPASLRLLLEGMLCGLLALDIRQANQLAKEAKQSQDLVSRLKKRLQKYYSGEYHAFQCFIAVGSPQSPQSPQSARIPRSSQRMRADSKTDDPLVFRVLTPHHIRDLVH